MKEIKIKGTDEIIIYDKCDNGLEIFIHVNEKINNFYATLTVKYGSVDTEFKVGKKKIKVPNGLAHFLEHLKFNQPDENATEYFAKLGSCINAVTSFEYTAYEVFAFNNFNENINYLLDYVQTPYFTKGQVRMEKGIIIEEIKMYDDIPGSILYSKTNECLFKKDNRRFLISGDASDVRDTTYEHITEVYDTFYHPENMFITITGNCNPEETIALIKENQNKKDFSKYLNPIKIKEEEPIEVDTPLLELNHNVEFPKIKIAFKMARDNFKNLDNIDLKLYLNLILSNTFSGTSTLKEELLKNELISGDIATVVTVRDNYVILSIIVETNYPTELVKKIKDEIDSLSINKDNLERKKKASIASFILRYDDIEAVNDEIQDSIILYGEIIDDKIDRIKDINITTAKKIIKGIKTDNYTTVIIYPFES